jgi:hypothetical protein
MLVVVFLASPVTDWIRYGRGEAFVDILNCVHLGGFWALIPNCFINAWIGRFWTPHNPEVSQLAVVSSVIDD